MKIKIRVFVFILLSFLFLTLLVIRVGAFQIPFNVNITPVDPTTNDEIAIIAAGEWKNSCVPEYQYHQILDDTIVINAVHIPPIGTLCADVILPWSVEVNIGQLPAGTYEVRVDVAGGSNTLTFTVQPASLPDVVINKIYYDTYISGEPEEAFQLLNTTNSPIDVTGWMVTDFEGTITLADSLGADQSIWIAREADDFYLEFGFKPDYEYQSDTDAAVPDLVRNGTLTLANSGDELALFDSFPTLIDSVVYESGDPTNTDWTGDGINPYDQGFFGLEGQILYRKLDPKTGKPSTDTNTLADWAQATDDDINGKKVQYPGWDLEQYFVTEKITQTATITYVVAPDALYDVVADYLGRAET